MGLYPAGLKPAEGGGGGLKWDFTVCNLYKRFNKSVLIKKLKLASI